MANNVIGLFDNESVAEQVVDDLVNSGFNRSSINRFKGDNSDLESELRREGIPDDEASYYVDGLNSGGALVSVRAEESDTDTAVEIMNRYANTGAGDTSYDTDYDSARTDADLETADYSTARSTSVDDEAHLDVVEERLNIGKREVDRGGVRVRRVVTETPVEEQVTLHDETIEVERRAVDLDGLVVEGRAVDLRVDGNATDLFTEQAYEFTETDEEAVVAKDTRVVEEVVVDKDVEERTETVRDTVRRADVEVEQLGGTAGSAGYDADAHTVYGETLAGDERYAGREWVDIEADARRDWETQNRGSNWDDARDSIRTSWERARRR
jgi:stress response protein YsnF